MNPAALTQRFGCRIVERKARWAQALLNSFLPRILPKAKKGWAENWAGRRKALIDCINKEKMGVFRYPIVLYSQDGNQRYETEGLVDTGATYTWIPSPILDKLGYKPQFKRRLRLGDGRVIEREGCTVLVELNGECLLTPVIFGDPATEILIGAVTLEQFSLAPDPIARKLVPVESFLA